MRYSWMSNSKEIEHIDQRGNKILQGGTRLKLQGSDLVKVGLSLLGS